MIEKDKSYEKMPQNIMSERETVLHFIEHSSFVGGHDELLQIVIDLLKKWSGCDAVAIRLREKNDYPYFATSGFPEHFPSTENNLISVNGELRCLCGSVISGKSDIKGCHYTEYGSFWVNHIDDSPDLANKTIGCIKNGFSSMALIPLKNESESLGLLQCNSYSNHCFNS